MQYIKKSMLALVFMLTTFSLANAKEDLTLLNTGGKTGGYSQQSLAYYTDLTKYKGDFSTVQLVNPGNKCVAINALLPKIKTPVLVPWGSDMEAKQRVDGCGATVDITKGTVVRFVEKFLFVCQVNPKLDITRNSGKVGHNLPINGPQAKTIMATNKSFGTKHKTVGYDGWGAAIIALFNGELDYAVVSPPGNAQVEAKGGTCMPLSRSDDSLFAKDTKNQNSDLVASNIDAWVVYNVDAKGAEALRSKLRKIHFDCDTAMSKWQKGCDSKGTAIHNSEFDIDKSHYTRWEDSVIWNTIK